MDDEQREMAHDVSLTSSKDDEKMKPETSWSDLQPEILSLILSNLFFWDSSNFRATCQSWKSISPPFPPPTDSALSMLPYLMVLNGSDCKFFQPLRNETFEKEIFELKDARIRFSSNGWLLMSQGETSMFFFNPFTKVKIKLPDLPRMNFFTSICFLSRPTSSDCVVIGIEPGSRQYIEFGIIKRGEDEWTFQTFDNRHLFVISDASPVLHNGKLYCMGEAGNVGVLDLGDSTRTWDVCTKPLSRWPCYKYRQSFMVNCDGGFFAVFVTNEERHVHVKKLNLPEMVWEDVGSLGDTMLYVSHGASLLDKAVEEGMANKIYFPKFHDGEIGVFYSLDTGKYHSIVGNYASTSSFNLAEQQSCTWIKATINTTPIGFGTFKW